MYHILIISSKLNKIKKRNMDRSEQERDRRAMQEKINKQYIEAKVNPIIEPMTIALFNDN